MLWLYILGYVLIGFVVAVLIKHYDEDDDLDSSSVLLLITWPFVICLIVMALLELFIDWIASRW